MTAAFLGASAGIIEDGFENSAAYLHGWLTVLKVKDNKTWLIKAASEAQRAADYVLGVSRDQEGGSPGKPGSVEEALGPNICKPLLPSSRRAVTKIFL